MHLVQVLKADPSDWSYHYLLPKRQEQLADTGLLMG